MTFVPAPFAPRKTDVLYSQQEDVTVIRWRMSAGENDPAVSYELADGNGGWQSINFAASLYPGGVAACGTGGGLCAQMVLPGRYRPPEDGSPPVRSRNPTYGISPGDTPTEEIYTQTLAVDAHFKRGNQTLAVAIDDDIGGNPVYVFPRPLERSVWDRRALCVPGFYPPEAEFAPVDGLNQTWPGPAPLSDAGRYCAGVRTQPASGATGTDVQVAIDTVPEVVEDDPKYTVPTEMTDFTYQIVLDLSIPVPNRCQEAIQTIQSTVQSILGKRSALRPLPTIDLSAGIDPQTGMPGTPCRQSPYRALDGVAQQVKLAAAAWPEQHQRYYMLYFNNLRAPLPDSLTRSLSDFSQIIVTPPPTGDFQALLWAWGPAEMTSSFGGWNLPPESWSAADDPSFVAQLTDFARQNLPLISEIQDPMQPVPLLSAAQAQQYDGGFIRLCTISITPLQNTGLQMVGHDTEGNLIILPTAAQYPVKKDDPPAYLLELPSVWAVPDVGFTPHKAEIHYEICTRYCDHLFTAESGSTVLSGWMDSPYCLGPATGGGM